MNYMQNEEKIFNYLLKLQMSGVTNMVVMSAHLEIEFGIRSSEASICIGNWINSFQRPECINCE